MSDGEVEKVVMPPYLPFTTFDNFITEIGKTHLPTQIDKSVLGNKSGSIQSWLPNALRFFGLTDASNRPQPSLDKLSKLSGDERSAVYGTLVKSAYKELFDTVDTQKGTQTQLEDWFRAKGLAGSTASRSSAFFQDICKRGGIELSPFFNKKSVTKTSSSKRKKRSAATLNNDADGGRYEEPEVSELNIPALDEKLILGLIERLPKPGDCFPRDKRDRWIQMAQLLFDEVYGAEP